MNTHWSSSVPAKAFFFWKSFIRRNFYCYCMLYHHVHAASAQTTLEHTHKNTRQEKEGNGWINLSDSDTFLNSFHFSLYTFLCIFISRLICMKVVGCCWVKMFIHFKIEGSAPVIVNRCIHMCVFKFSLVLHPTLFCFPF